MIETKRRSPLKAIRQYCIECAGDSMPEVRQCHLTDCPLYGYRMGKSGRVRVLSPEQRAATAKRLANCRGKRNDDNTPVI